MFPSIAPVVRTLILINVAVFGIEMISRGAAGITYYYFALWPWDSTQTPYSAPFAPWQIVTYSFLHSPQGAIPFSHLFFNMFGLYMFGSDVERSMGAKKFVAYYFVSVIGAALLQMLTMAIGLSPKAAIVGASGGLFGILLAYAIAFPHRKLIVFPIPVPMSARVFVSLYAGVELWLGITGSVQGVAHFAHLGGALAGYLLILYWRHAPRR